MSQRILVVDDERPIADILKFNLEKEGYTVGEAFEGGEALKRLKEDHFDLLILDVMLPGLDGYAVCREVRRFSRLPILMLTAKDEEVDIVLGLEMGADDYLTKPFGARELLARVRALLRRSQMVPTGQEKNPLAFGQLEIDLQTYEVRKNGIPAGLTLKEFELLKFLATHPGQVFNREALLNEVWGYEYFGEARTVDVTIRRLREKIEENPAEPEFIQTKRGVGYFFKKAEYDRGQ